MCRRPCVTALSSKLVKSGDGLSSFNFPVAASLSLAGLVLALGTMWLVRRCARPLEALGGH